MNRGSIALLESTIELESCSSTKASINVCTRFSRRVPAIYVTKRIITLHASKPVFRPTGNGRVLLLVDVLYCRRAATRH